MQLRRWEQSSWGGRYVQIWSVSSTNWTHKVNSGWLQGIRSRGLFKRDFLIFLSCRNEAMYPMRGTLIWYMTQIKTSAISHRFNEKKNLTWCWLQLPLKSILLRPWNQIARYIALCGCFLYVAFITFLEKIHYISIHFSLNKRQSIIWSFFQKLVRIFHSSLEKLLHHMH